MSDYIFIQRYFILLYQLLTSYCILLFYILFHFHLATSKSQCEIFIQKSFWLFRYLKNLMRRDTTARPVEINRISKTWFRCRPRLEGEHFCGGWREFTSF